MHVGSHFRDFGAPCDSDAWRCVVHFGAGFFVDLVMQADLTDRSCQVVVPCCFHLCQCRGLLHGWMMWGGE